MKYIENNIGMGLSVKRLISELNKYNENKKVRILFGMPTPILWLSHDEHNQLKNGCVLVTSDEINLSKTDRIETVGELLWHLQFFKSDALVWNTNLNGCWCTICEVSDEIKDAEGNFIDIVFLINFAHMIG